MRYGLFDRVNALISACLVSSCIPTAGWSQTLTWLGVLRDCYPGEFASVSANGQVVVGNNYTDDGDISQAFRWTPSGGIVPLLTPGVYSLASGVSADGLVVVGGFLTSTGAIHAFRWESGRLQDLGTLGGNQSEAYAVSANGEVVVGYSLDRARRTRAFRWESGRMQDLGTLGGDWSVAYSVSADGNVVVGWSTTNGGTGYRAFRWTASDGMEGLGTLGGDFSEAFDVSADGSVVVGQSADGRGRYPAFRWKDGRMHSLGTLGGYEARAYGVSADGSVVVGYSVNSTGAPRAFRWTDSGGMEDLNITYANLLARGSVLTIATDVSPDGRYIVGQGYNAATGRREVFLLNTCAEHGGDVDNNRCIDDADLLAVLFAFGSTGSNLGRVDVNCDQIVDDADLLTVLFNFGSGC